VVFLSEQNASIYQKYDGNTYELILREPWTKKIVVPKSNCSGSGFFIVRGLDIYLITAEHVAKCLNGQSKVKFQGPSQEKKEYYLHELTTTSSDSINLEWKRHPKADIALLYLGKLTDKMEKQGFKAINYSSMVESLVAPNRFNDLTIFGFPLGLGETVSTISPITKNIRPASDVIYLGRADNGVVNPYILLDDASVGGFSGGPVLEIKQTPKNSPVFDGQQIGISPLLVGLIHGNRSGANGLDGFAAIVPAQQILEVLDIAPKFSGKHVFYYPNGKIWSERIYKDGLPWSVISNFDLNGNPQEKGTLTNGNGTLHNWNEKSTMSEVQIFKSGKYIGNAINMKIGAEAQN